MRVLLSTIGTRGDVQPLVALASQLRALGQEVRLCVPPDFQEWIDSLGFPVTPIGPELRKMTAASPPATPTSFSPEQRRQLAEGTVITQFETIATADPTVGPWPDPADPTMFQTGAWMLPDERPLSRELETFLEAGEPPVYFGFGSMRGRQDLSHVMIRAARALGRRAIVSRGWADLSLVDNEPDCLAIGEVNQHAPFTRVAAVVHHGGAGSTTAAALAVTPQVVIPQLSRPALLGTTHTPPRHR